MASIDLSLLEKARTIAANNTDFVLCGPTQNLAIMLVEQQLIRINNIKLRGYSFGKRGEVREDPEQLTFHWITQTGTRNGKVEYSHTKYTPRMTPLKIDHIIAQHNPTEFNDFTRVKHNDLKYSCESGYYVKPCKKNTIEEPNPTTMKIIQQGVEIIKKRLTQNIQYRRDMERDGEKAIKQRFEELCETARITRNNEHLGKADFWRKLKYSMLREEHRLLISGALEMHFDMEVLEYELRAAYDEEVNGVYMSVDSE